MTRAQRLAVSDGFRRADELARGWLSAAAPPPTFMVSQWADEKRFLPESSASRGSRWSTARTPYLRGIMDAVHEPGIRTIALMKGAQVGGSECLHNILGYFIEHDQSPMLLVHPTVEVAEEWSKERLADMIRTSPALEQKIDAVKSTLTFKVFTGGFLALGGANTPNTFARRAVRVAFGDDVDRWPAVVGEEGDPADLLLDRTRTFAGEALHFFVSTPTLKRGRIDTLFERSDRRRFHVECPGCGHWDWITWTDRAHFRVTFDDRDPETARLSCPQCELALFEPERRQMISAGEWRATATPEELGLVGFHLPALVSTLGDVTLPGLVNAFLAANAKGRESLRVFINTTLAEGWEEQGTRMQPQVLYNRREPYGETAEGERVEVPAGVGAITCGVDVQEAPARFELQVVGWGLGEERWVLDYRVIDGDPRRPEIQEELLQALSRRYASALGPLLPIHATCLDCGHFADAMYDLVLRYQGVKRLWGVKGFGGRSGEPIVGKPQNKTAGKKKIPIRLYPINTDDAKAEWYGSLGLASAGPGATHFPLGLDTVDEEYFAQLCAEHRETKYNKAGIATHNVWVQDRERNEALDTAVYALAARRLLNPNIRQMLEAISIAAATLPPRVDPVAAAAPSPSPPAPPPISPAVARMRARRHQRSAYLNR
jgi:phage terminase large subunit GpA-like protein